MMWQVQPATQTAAPPVGDSDGRVIRQRRGKPPTRCRIAPPAPAPPGFRRRGAGGGSPRRNKPKISPFPTGEERFASAGRGDRGKKFMMRQVQPATKTAAPPPPSGIATARLSGNAGASPPLGAGLRPLPPRRLGSARGCKGRSPLHKKTKNLPLPHGGKSALRARVGGIGDKTL